MKDPDYKYKLLMRKVRDEKEKNERDARNSGSGGSGGSARKSRSQKSSSRPLANRSAVQRDRMQHRKHTQSQMPAWAASTEERSGTASSSSSTMTVESTVSDRQFRVTNWTQGSSGGGESRGGESSSLNEWGMHQHVPNQLPPIGL